MGASSLHFLFHPEIIRKNLKLNRKFQIAHGQLNPRVDKGQAGGSRLKVLVCRLIAAHQKGQR